MLLCSSRIRLITLPYLELVLVFLAGLNRDLGGKVVLPGAIRKTLHLPRLPGRIGKKVPATKTGGCTPGLLKLMVTRAAAGVAIFASSSRGAGERPRRCDGLSAQLRGLCDGQ